MILVLGGRPEALTRTGWIPRAATRSAPEEEILTLTVPVIEALAMRRALLEQPEPVLDDEAALLQRNENCPNQVRLRVTCSFHRLSPHESALATPRIVIAEHSTHFPAENRHFFARLTSSHYLHLGAETASNASRKSMFCFQRFESSKI